LNRFVRYAVLVLGIAASAIAVVCLPELYHHTDQEFFSDWARHWDQDWRNIYVNSPTCNYPIIGTLSSAGLLSLLGGESAGGNAYRYRLLLSIVDGLNVVLLYVILRRLRIKNAALWAGVIGLLPSSWVGGALWGQIDGVTQCVLLITLLCLVLFTTRQTRPRPGAFVAYLVIVSVLLACLVLTKQLAVLSAVALGLFLLISIYAFAATWSRAFAYAFLAGGCFLLCLFLPDVWLKVRPPYFSHLEYVWRTGSGHMEKIAGNGFNIWVFLGRDMWSSSREPFLLFLTPKGTGLVLFGLWAALVSCSFLLYAERRLAECRPCVPDKQLLLHGVWYLALLNLTFNVYISGTHERHLYHFYPYAILACLGLEGQSRAWRNVLLGVLVAGAVLYGLFVLGILSNAPRFLGPQRLAAFHLALLWYLTFVFVKDQGLFAHVRSFSRRRAVQRA